MTAREYLDEVARLAELPFPPMSNRDADAVPRLVKALEAVLEVLTPHIEYQLRREAKFGRTESTCVCEQCRAWKAIEDALKGEQHAD